MFLKALRILKCESFIIGAAAGALDFLEAWLKHVNPGDANPPMPPWADALLVMLDCLVSYQPRKSTPVRNHTTFWPRTHIWTCIRDCRPPWCFWSKLSNVAARPLQRFMWLAEHAEHSEMLE